MQSEQQTQDDENLFPDDTVVRIGLRRRRGRGGRRPPRAGSSRAEPASRDAGARSRVSPPCRHPLYCTMTE